MTLRLIYLSRKLDTLQGSGTRLYIYIYMYFEDGRSTSRNALDKDLIEIIHEYKDIGESASKR